MNKAGGFITLHRQILDWEWYKNINVKVLFLHLLLKANFREGSFEGHKILRGQLVTSLSSLASELGLSVRQIRVSLDKLILTGEVTSRSFPKYRIITIVKYDDYQDDDRLNGSQMTGRMSGKGQADDKLVTSKGQARDKLVTTIEQYNKNNKVTMEQGNNEREGTAQRFIPPTIAEIKSFCQENGLSVDAEHFVDHYVSNGWMVGKNKMKDWRSTVRNWARRDQKAPEPVKPTPVKTVVAQQYEQRDYSGVQAELMAEQDRQMEAFLRS